jgi:hypothetical protein
MTSGSRHCGRRRAGSVLAATALAVLLAAGAGPAAASVWCGDNGVVRFSFAVGDSLVSLAHVEPENGVTVVDVVAWLTDVDEVARRGDAFLRVGGVEMQLEITGAEAFIMEQEFPSKALNVGQRQGQLAVGFVPGQKLRDGRAELVRWKVMFQGRPENVRFGLKREGLVSCKGMDDCRECDPPAVYVGIEANGQLDSMFGAGYEPAWLNPAGEADQTPDTGTCTWRDVGVYQAR